MEKASASTAAQGSGAIGMVDAVTNKRLDEEFKVGAHPESFQLEKTGPNIHVNVPDSQQIAVINRNTHAAELRRCAREMLGESDSPLRTVLVLAEDLLRSLIKEYFGMALNRIPQLAILLTLTTFVAGTAVVNSQQVLRLSGNDPQIQLAEDAARRLNSGEAADRVTPDRKVDMAASLTPFVIVYDDAGRPITSSGSLDGVIPTLPRGVFDFVRSKAEEQVTWQPRTGVRIASVVVRTTHGFVVAGRNLREIEIRKDKVAQLALLGWLVANLALVTIWLLIPVFGSAKPTRMPTAV